MRTAVVQRKHDECLRACVSYLLDVDYEATPSISAADARTEEFWDAWVEWAADRGYQMLFYYDGMPAATDWIAVVPSLNQPGKDHAVVMRHAGLVLDPVSNGERYTRAPRKAKYGIEFAAASTQPRDQERDRG